MAGSGSDGGSTRLVDVLFAMDEAGELTYSGGSGDRYTIQTTEGRMRRFGPAETWAWLHGRKAGLDAREAHATLPRTSSGLEEIRAVLVDPSPSDLRRLRIWHAMQESGVGIKELAERFGVTRKSMRDWLTLGHRRELVGERADEILALLPPHAVADPPVNEGARVRPPSWSRREPAGIRRARMLAFAHEQGLVRYVDPLNPMKALHARSFTFETATGRRVVASWDVLEGWLVGIADGMGDLATADALIPGEAG